ncbi:MAG: UvrD-helicase domain-containing protein [Halioglobus sp.]
MTGVVDQRQRELAIDPLGSYCVSAPAGSGKTELLIQRYLGLLPRVARPEQIVAITFTRKAAAEMRERVLQALQGARDDTPCGGAHEEATRALAKAALQADAQGQWQLQRNVSRLNIKTIDSFCLALTRQMPILSGFGGQASPQDDCSELYLEAVAQLFELLDSGKPLEQDLRALLAHFDNNWDGLQALLVSMLQRRDQWRSYIGGRGLPAEAEAYLRHAVAELVREKLQALTRQLAPYSSELLELMQYSAENLGNSVPKAFPAPLADSLGQWRRLRSMLMTKGGTWLKSPSVRNGFPAAKSGQAKERKHQLLSLLRDLGGIEELEQQLAAVSLLPETEEGSQSWQLVLHLSRLLPYLAAQLRLVFSAHGVVDHSEVALLALQALGEEDAPTELALRLDYGIEHLLVDEFQDTSINQFTLLHKLTRGWGEHNAEHPDAPRTLMIVGDAMQSIYGFRDANVGLFLRARDEGFNGVQLQPLELACNFRSDAGVIDWVNQVFSQAFPSEDNIAAAQVKYTPAVAVRAGEEGPQVSLNGFLGDSADAAAAEVDYICREIAQRVAGGETGMAVLGRQRNHLRPISRRLRELGVDFFAQDLESLAHSAVVGDLMTLCRTLADDVDLVAWFALLRAPWCGLRLADLLALAQASRQDADEPGKPLRLLIEEPDVLARLSEEGRQRLAHVSATLRMARMQRDRLGLRVWVEQAWLQLGGPQIQSSLLALQDAQDFFVLLEQAEGEGRGLDLDWLARKVEVQFTGGGDPECPVHLLTLHKAKGLEFRRVYIPRLNGLTAPDKGELLMWDQQNVDSGPIFLLAANDRSPAGTPTLYNYLRAQKARKRGLEATRLLYVGATRAIEHLHLSAGIIWDEKNDCPKAPGSNSLLSSIWPAFAESMHLHEVNTSARAITAESETAPPLLRLTAQALPAIAQRLVPTIESDNVPDRPENFDERAIGTVVHAALEALSLQSAPPDTVSVEQKNTWEMQLRQEGLAGQRLEAGLASVLASVERTLASEEGRWVLSNTHREPRSEWALTMCDAHGTRDIVIDRSFIDSTDDVRWIVDYKTSQPAPGEALQAFLLREATHYREQLLIYREALTHCGNEAIRCALFFTALGVLHPLDELHLARRGE